MNSTQDPPQIVYNDQVEASQMQNVANHTAAAIGTPVSVNQITPPANQKLPQYTVTQTAEPEVKKESKSSRLVQWLQFGVRNSRSKDFLNRKKEWMGKKYGPDAIIKTE